jgi:D-alanyl-D-alanine carboxypeptidase/D-alanyl-D-alanine-endopeptidase (penicillin-binding protein 4)
VQSAKKDIWATTNQGRAMLTARKYSHLLLLILVLLQAWAVAAAVTASDNGSENGPLTEIAKLVDNGGYAVERHGRPVLFRNAEQPLVPASILKIATGLAALHILGPEYRFTTTFYLDRENDLYIRGGGDPFLISEEVDLILDRLQERGVSKINDIVLDDSAFQLTAPADGLGGSDNPYDAENSALAVNFNTVHFIKAVDGTVRSAEPQTPTLPLMVELAKDMGPGTYRLNITTAAAGKQVIGRHVGELFRGLQQKKHIAGGGSIRKGVVPAGLTPQYEHQSSITVKDGLERLLLYSNNFIANQFFLVCGMARFGPPATWQKGRAALQEFMHEQLGLANEQIFMAEGSGISHRNWITVQAMLRVLDRFKPYAYLLPRTRRDQQDILVKSGTLTGVYSYAGYFIREQELDGFVLILNQKENTRDRLLNLLAKIYHRDVSAEERH